MGLAFVSYFCLFCLQTEGNEEAAGGRLTCVTLE